MSWERERERVSARSIDRSVRSILTGVLAGGEVEDLDDMIHALHLLGVRERVRKPEPRLVLKPTKKTVDLVGERSSQGGSVSCSTEPQPGPVYALNSNVSKSPRRRRAFPFRNIQPTLRLLLPSDTRPLGILVIAILSIDRWIIARPLRGYTFSFRDTSRYKSTVG